MNFCDAIKKINSLTLYLMDGEMKNCDTYNNLEHSDITELKNNHISF
jgi:hypothetical protein